MLLSGMPLIKVIWEGLPSLLPDAGVFNHILIFPQEVRGAQQ